MKNRKLHTDSISMEPNFYIDTFLSSPENSEATDTSKRQKSNTKSNRTADAIDSEDDVDSESTSFALMERITRNGSSLRQIQKRFAEIEKQDNVIIDSDSFLCIICFKNKKNSILLPCLHQHTCERCWILWKIRQLNILQPNFDDDDDDDDHLTKPKCPVCRQGVDKVKVAKN